MKKLQYATLVLVKASDGNPVISVGVVILFFIMFNTFEGMIEILLFGERFEHWLDPLFMAAFIAYSGYSVMWCAAFKNIEKDESNE